MSLTREIFCVLRNLHCFQIDITSSLESDQDLGSFSLFCTYVYLFHELCDKHSDIVKYLILVLIKWLTNGNVKVQRINDSSII